MFIKYMYSTRVHISTLVKYKEEVITYLGYGPRKVYTYTAMQSLEL
jgi:hypothetical protein